ncbi:hypothetical protein [Jiangella alba]|uniref:Uncharacterized protein n=1 Tax=Jiangella alba TaxID=561176 RepID=A0A1H5MQ36_9ACTN|nr:hypothetical protein [Jiangella alba]SEE90857.1 hypothetical protein SAMN04488561_3299 [Jiangella alba]
MLTAGCSASAEHATQAIDPAALTFSYEATAAPGYLDQTLTIDNANSASVALTAELTPLDADGAPLPDVAVETVYGSERGRLVLPPGDNVDILMFHGARAADVSDVQVEVTGIEPVDHPDVTSVVAAIPVDSAGNEAIPPAPFSRVVLQNDNAAAVSVSVLCIVWDNPEPGRSQQALQVVEVGSTTVPASGSSDLKLSPEVATEIQTYADQYATSLKAVFTR